MSEEEIENYKIGMYTLGEIYNEMTNNMLQRSMTDAIRDKFYELEMQLHQKENIIKEVREYANTNKNCVPKHIKDYINNLLDKEVN